jgi:hypothetical protein
VCAQDDSPFGVTDTQSLRKERRKQGRSACPPRRATPVYGGTCGPIPLGFQRVTLVLVIQDCGSPELCVGPDLAVACLRAADAKPGTLMDRVGALMVRFDLSPSLIAWLVESMRQGGHHPSSRPRARRLRSRARTGARCSGRGSADGTYLRHKGVFSNIWPFS